MENLYIKEKRLETALEKLKSLSSSYSGGQNEINDLCKKNNLKDKDSEKIENSDVKVMDGIKEKVEFKLPAGIRYKRSKKELIA